MEFHKQPPFDKKIRYFQPSRFSGEIYRGSSHRLEVTQKWELQNYLTHTTTHEPLPK
jgi:hypothetical protein